MCGRLLDGFETPQSSMDNDLDLSRFIVPSPIDEVFYIPEFITEEEEEYLTRKVIHSRE